MLVVELLAVKTVVISLEMVVIPQFSDIRIMRYRGLTLVEIRGSLQKTRVDW